MDRNFAYIILALFYGSIVLGSCFVMGYLIYRSFQSKYKDYKAKKRRKHLRIVK